MGPVPVAAHRRLAAPDRVGAVGQRGARVRGATRTTWPGCSPSAAPRSPTGWPPVRPTVTPIRDVGALGLAAADGGPLRGRRRPRCRDRRRAPGPTSWDGPSPTPPRCGSRGSTSRTTTATGTRCTTPSPRPTRSTRRWCGHRRPSWSGASYHEALRIYLDRFLNVPAARLPTPAEPGDSTGLDALDVVLGRRGPRRRGRRDRLPATCAGRGRRRASSPPLGHALLDEDAEFHWYQTFEASVRQFHVVAGGLRGGRARPHRRRPVPRRPHAHPARAAPGRADRHPPGPRRGALRRRRDLTRWTDGRRSHSRAGSVRSRCGVSR